MSEKNFMSIILIVDDAPENIDVLSGILREDYRIKAALDGERALKIAESPSPPDLILLDVMMPKMDGYEVCRRLKENPATNKIPVTLSIPRMLQFWAWRYWPNTGTMKPAAILCVPKIMSGYWPSRWRIIQNSGLLWMGI